MSAKGGETTFLMFSRPIFDSLGIHRHWTSRRKQDGMFPLTLWSALVLQMVDQQNNRKAAAFVIFPDCLVCLVGEILVLVKHRPSLVAVEMALR